MSNPFNFDQYTLGGDVGPAGGVASSSPFASGSGRASIGAPASLYQAPEQPEEVEAAEIDDRGLSVPSGLTQPKPQVAEPTTEDESAPRLAPAGFTRRTSVSAEPFDPSADSASYPKIVIPKTDEQRQRIINATKRNILFQHLDEAQYGDVVDAMKEVAAAAGSTVIEQGAEGDFFYVVESGQLEVIVNGRKVSEYVDSGSFGELALMYNAPRAATIRATSNSVLWALDRFTFRRILMQHTLRKRQLYESFLAEVDILATLNKQELGKIADALEEVTYQPRETVIVQGEIGKNFYIIISGYADVIIRKTEDAPEERIGTLKKGDYFGELALLSTKPRAATVRAKDNNTKLVVATLDKQAFTRLLGPIRDILETRAAGYNVTDH